MEERARKSFIADWKVPHHIVRDASFRQRFPERLDLRWALLLPRDLPYPGSVESALRKHRCKHVTSEGGRCAGFALGLSRREPHGLVWYVNAIQSDLAFAPSSRLRDYLRGWRSALFSVILSQARAHRAVAVALPPAEAVAKAALWWMSRMSNGAPASWLNIYDRTASDFSMALEEVALPVNIQVVPRRRRVMHDTFFLKRLVS